jgi:hypothetical protein
MEKLLAGNAIFGELDILDWVLELCMALTDISMPQPLGGISGPSGRYVFPRLLYFTCLTSYPSVHLSQRITR